MRCIRRALVAGFLGRVRESRRDKNLGVLGLGFQAPWTQPRQAKKNTESEPPVEANITLVIFRVRLALGIFRVCGGNA